MNLPTQLERDLFDYLSPERQVEVNRYLESLENDPLNECPNCGTIIADADSFCSEGCEAEFLGVDELMVREEPVLDEDRLRDQEQDR